MNGVLPIIKRNSGCDYHRIINPMSYLGCDTRSMMKVSNDELLKNTKILVFNRTPDNDFLKVIHLRNKYGFKIVMDLDDYWELNSRHPMYNTWIEKKIGEEIIKWMTHADAVTVTTSRLADKVLQYNKNVHVLPNALPFGYGQFTDEKSSSHLTRFIYTGGESHLWDMNILRTPFSKLTQLQYAQFILAGYHSENPKVWGRMENMFNVGGKLKNYERREFKPLESYMTSYIDADVCLVPLEYNIFTPYKSNIKFLEAGCKNIPVICSNTPPYSDEPNKDMVMYASNSREWVDHIKYCYENSSYVKESGQRLGQYVRANYDLNKINEYRIQLFNHLMN